MTTDPNPNQDHCDGCVYYREECETSPEMMGFGQCRRSAPSVAKAERGGHQACWPPMIAADWCGDFSPALVRAWPCMSCHHLHSTALNTERPEECVKCKGMVGVCRVPFNSLAARAAGMQ